MIDKKELRIGNLIKSVFKEPFEDIKITLTVRVCEILDHAVRSDVMDDIKLPKFGNSEHYGIPLTEEWLRRLPKGLIYPEWIEYLHELQNWYYWNNEKKELHINLS